MDKELERLADHVKDQEFKDLFPDTEVEKARNDEEKVKEAVFQVHFVAWNKDLYELVHSEEDDRYSLPIPEIRSICDTKKDFERIEKLLKGATLSTNDNGDTVVPKTDLNDVLSPRKGLMD